jgi:hypothetical protein
MAKANSAMVLPTAVHDATAARDTNMLNAFALPDDVALCVSPIRVGTLDILVSEFRTAFAGIDYEVDAQTRIVNAQAFSVGDKRVVRLYGGLAFHPLVNEDALAFALLHETGHHHARGRRLAGDPRIACDCLADRWAVGAGATALRRAAGRAINLGIALESLDALIASMGDQARGPSTGTNRGLCWTGCWTSRKSRLTAGEAAAPAGRCYYQF